MNVHVHFIIGSDNVRTELLASLSSSRCMLQKRKRDAADNSDGDDSDESEYNLDTPKVKIKLKSPKLLSQLMRKRYYLTLGTSSILKSPASPSSLKGIVDKIELKFADLRFKFLFYFLMLVSTYYNFYSTGDSQKSKGLFF